MTTPAAKTATFTDSTATGLGWTLTEWAGFTPRRDDLSGQTPRLAAQLIRRLRRRGIVVKVLGYGPGASDLRAIAE